MRQALYSTIIIIIIIIDLIYVASFRQPQKSKVLIQTSLGYGVQKQIVSAECSYTIQKKCCFKHRLNRASVKDGFLIAAGRRFQTAFGPSHLASDRGIRRSPRETERMLWPRPCSAKAVQ